jgi:predicted negative regulator of RcsB-dependent stress response
LHTQGKAEAAQAALKWVSEAAPDAALKDIARLRLSGLLLDADQTDAALTQLTQPFTPAMAGLAADLRGDVLLLKGQKTEAVAAYKAAWLQLSEQPDYRRLVQAKLNAQGVDPEAATLTDAGNAK